MTAGRAVWRGGSENARSEDARAGAPPTAIISDGLWRNQFGSDPEIIGRLIRPRPSTGTLGGLEYPPLEIVGVLPRDFRSPADLEARDIWTVSDPIVSRTGLELARLPAVESSLSIHAAAGAGRGRLARITMARSVLLCLAGGLMGMLLAIAAHDLVLANLPLSFPRQVDIRMESGVLLFSFGLSVVCSLLIASVPAIRASRPNLGALLASADRSTTESRGRRGFLNVLTAVQCGVTLVLVFAAGLLIHTFWILTAIDTGFDPDNLMAFSVSLPGDYSVVARQNALERAKECHAAHSLSFRRFDRAGRFWLCTRYGR